MKYPGVPCIDFSKVESTHQVANPKRRRKGSNLKRIRVLSRREIAEQLLHAPYELEFR